MSGKIFINYRRGDDPGNTGRLFDRLHDVFGPQQLFLDVDNIAPGLDFVRVLNERVGECDILLAVIGKSWVEASDASGKRRLDDPDDFVRLEIESALNQNKRVIPVLVGDAPMPRWDELPGSLQPLARRNAVRLTHERFRADSQGLIKALQQALIDIDEHKRAQAQAEAERQVEEQRRLAAAEAARLAEERARAEQAAAEARERAAAERRLAAEAEAARLAEEKARRDQADAEAREQAAEQRRRHEAAAKQRADAERDFAAARRTNTIAAIEAFQLVHPDSHLSVDANELKAALLVRAEAYRHAMMSDDVAALKSFLRAYRKGPDSLQVREKLRSLQPRDGLGFARPGLIGATAVIILGIAVLGLQWRGGSPAIVEQQASDAAPATQAAPAPPVTAAAQTAPSAPAPAVVPVASTPESSSNAAANSTVSAKPPAATVSAAEQIAWDLVKDSKDPDQLRRFVEQFPNSAHRAEVEGRIASLPTPAPAVASVPAPVRDPHELARAMQFELKRVGCFLGTVNGEFDAATAAAWHQFTKLTSITLPDEASSDAINALRGVGKRICPLLCASGQHADGDRCVGNAPPAAPSKSAPQAGRTGQEAVVDARPLAVGTVIQGGVTTCGPNGCQHIPKNCHAVKLGRDNPGWKGLGGKIVCP